MLSIFVEGSAADLSCFKGSVTLESLSSWAQEAVPFPIEDIYFTHNGKKLLDSTPVSEGVIRVVPRVVGGKGGFGSMLRAIGAQIEKTTNREACRDLSGRRLRDINEEKRLKNWISKKADREREAKERKKKKLERLRAEPRIEFSDKKYEEDRTKLTEVVHDAVEQGFQASASRPSSSGVNKKPAARKGFMFEEEELSVDSSEISSDEPSENEESERHTAESESDESSPTKRPHAEVTGSDSDEPSQAKRQHVEETSSDSDEPSPAQRPRVEETDSSDESSSESDKKPSK